MIPWKKFIISCSIILMLTSVSATASGDKQLENLLPQEVAIVASCKHLAKHWQLFRDSEIFAFLAKIHHKTKPQQPPLEESAAQIASHPLFQLLKDEVVVGMVPAEVKGDPPTFIILGRSDAAVPEIVAAVYSDEEAKGKLHRLADQEYQGQKILVSLHAEKNKIQKRFTLAAQDFFVLSNELAYVKGCYDRWMELAQGGLQLPSLYRKLPATALLRLCVDFNKLKLDLSDVKKPPLPELQEFFTHVRNSITATQYMAASLTVEDGGHLHLLRERLPQTPTLLANIDMPAHAIDEKTLLFLTTPIPYQLFWYGIKHKTKKKFPRKWRKIKARINELFDWKSFEKDILPGIGPQTALDIRLPQNTTSKFVLPQISLLLQLASNVDMQQPLEKLWQLAKKNRKIAKHASISKEQMHGVSATKVRFVDTPLDQLLDPAYAFPPGWMIISSQSSALDTWLNIVKNGKDSKQVKIFAHLNFANIAELLDLNTAALKKLAHKKGKPFAEKKFAMALRALRFFKHIQMEMSDYENLEVLQMSLKLK